VSPGDSPYPRSMTALFDPTLASLMPLSLHRANLPTLWNRCMP
jgi:hypothetical protein